MEHDVLVWGPGNKTSKGETIPYGYVWTCSCGESRTGIETEQLADIFGEIHLIKNGKYGKYGE